MMPEGPFVRRFGRGVTERAKGPPDRPRARERGARSVPLRPMSTLVPEHDPRITPLPAAEIRKRFVEIFEERGHTAVPSASLAPAGDQTRPFTNSGMVQSKEVITGAEKRSDTRPGEYR